ncbi:MAG: hypothetical protein K2K90_18235 [Lachnospiraceae bacterium]|nr:hypothetical protein [Lachnospiraceae bacterium]
MRGKRIAEILILAACLIVIAAVVILFAAGAGYTVLSGDDFTHGVRVGAFHVSLPQYFAASLLYVKDLYMDWQGTWFSMFLQAFLSPINNFGLPQLRAVMVGNALLFLISLAALLCAGLSFFRMEEDAFSGQAVFGTKRLMPLRLVILLLFFLTVVDADVYAEIYFWFSGAVAYSMPFSLLLMAGTLILLMNQEKCSIRGKKVCAGIAAVLLFLSSGGSLAVAGVGCYMALALTVVFFLSTGKVSWYNLTVFAAGFAGALINAAAPGNFSRHDGTAGAGLHFGQAIVDSVRMFAEESGRLFRETMLGLVFLLLIAAGVYLSGRCRIAFREYGIATVLALPAGLVAYFPVALGYGGYYVPNRCYFIIDTAMVISLLNLALFLGVCCHRLCGLPSDGRTVTVLLYICLAALIVTPLSMEELPLYRVARHVHNGSYREYYEKCAGLYDYLENCPEEDVELEMPEYIDDFECFYFDEDENGWVNQGIAAYYGKRSVRRAQ